MKELVLSKKKSYFLLSIERKEICIFLAAGNSFFSCVMCFQVRTPNTTKQTNKQKKKSTSFPVRTPYFTVTQLLDQEVKASGSNKSMTVNQPATQATFSVYSPVTYLVGSCFPTPGALTQTSPSKQDVLLGSSGALPSKAKPGGWRIQVVGTPPHCR